MLKKGEVKMIHKLLKDGLSKSEIPRKLDISRDTVIAKMRTFRDYGMSYNRIATALNNKQTPTRSGTPWTSMQVSRAINYK